MGHPTSAPSEAAPAGGTSLSRPDSSSSARHVLINGLSIGGGGGYTVGRELAQNLALVRPNWHFTLALIDAHPLHAEMRREQWPENCQLLFAPASARRLMARDRYERRNLCQWAAKHEVSAVVQLNGMIVPGMAAPTLCHFQDPWPYRPEAWNRPLVDHVLALFKRRAHARALRSAAACGFTSNYLKDLILGALGVTPPRAEVYYNGVPEAWIEGPRQSTLPLVGRPMEIVTVSNVSRYKRQALVVQAVALLKDRPGLERLVYRIAGDCTPLMREELSALAKSLGVGERVLIEGRVSDERVIELLGSARAFVTMSVCESFGIPMIEAMSFGTPVIAADCCALPEVGGGAVDLSPVDDAPALAGHLLKVLTDGAHAEELRRRGTLRARDFNWRTTGTQMARTLDAICAHAPGAPRPRDTFQPLS